MKKITTVLQPALAQSFGRTMINNLPLKTMAGFFALNGAMRTPMTTMNTANRILETVYPGNLLSTATGKPDLEQTLHRHRYKVLNFLSGDNS